MSSVSVYPKPMCCDSVNSQLNTEDRYRHQIQNAGELYQGLYDEKLQNDKIIFLKMVAIKLNVQRIVFKLSQTITTSYTTIIVLLIKI